MGVNLVHFGLILIFYLEKLPSNFIWKMRVVAKAAYKRIVWETHPDRFPLPQKPHAESRFKLVSEAYAYLLSGVRQEGSASGTYSRVVRYGGRRSHGGRSSILIGVPFLCIILGTFALGGSFASRAYKRQKEAYPSHNPFLP